MNNLPDLQTLDAAQSIWSYHCLDETIPNEDSTVDLIIGLGSYDTRVADKCVELYQQTKSKKIVFTGAFGNWTKGVFSETEAKTFAEIAIKSGVPKHHIVLEEKATNTGENIANVKALFPKCKIAIFVTKPLMQRRCRATVEKVWPKVKAIVTAPDHTIISQAIGHVDMQGVINELVGTHWRSQTYAKRGFQTEQVLDKTADAAFENLVAKGYTQNLPDNWQDELLSG